MKRVIMELEGDALTYRHSSNLQGVMFEHIAPEYAEYLHMQQRHPYSQYLYRDGEKVYWCVNAFEEEAEREILEPLLREDFMEFVIKNKGIPVKILRKDIGELSRQQITKEFYQGEPEHMYHIRLLSAVSFKQQGRYTIYPDMRLFYQSLMNKFSAVSDNADMFDEDLLDLMAEKTEIIGYNLRSVRFPIEKVEIPSFIGTFTVRIGGADTLAAFARMLFRFGEYSGVGVKSAMGMGAFKLIE